MISHSAKVSFRFLLGGVLFSIAPNKSRNNENMAFTTGETLLAPKYRYIETIYGIQNYFGKGKFWILCFPFRTMSFISPCSCNIGIKTGLS